MYREKYCNEPADSIFGSDSGNSDDEKYDRKFSVPHHQSYTIGENGRLIPKIPAEL